MMKRKKSLKAVSLKKGTAKKAAHSAPKARGLAKKRRKLTGRKTKSLLKKNSSSVIKKKKSKRKVSPKNTAKRHSQVKKTGLKSYNDVYNEGFNVGFAKGFEDGHALAYQGEEI